MTGLRSAIERSRPPRTGERKRGQSLVEFAMIITVVMLLLLGMLEFGFLFDHHLTLEYATREGARVGAALANGGGTLGCGSGQSPNAANVDKQIIAAVQRVITSPGSAVVKSRITEIRIYKANATGGVTSTFSNKWVYSAGAGTVRGWQEPRLHRAGHHRLDRLLARQRIGAGLDRRQPQLQLPTGHAALRGDGLLRSRQRADHHPDQ